MLTLIYLYISTYQNIILLTVAIESKYVAVITVAYKTR